MAHYAFLDENNIVTEVIVGKDEGEDGIDWEAHYGAFRGQTCKRTSYNTHGGVHSVAVHLSARTTLAWVTPTMPSVMRLFPQTLLTHGYLNEDHLPLGCPSSNA
jgi:hypothetical protein